MDIPTDPAGVDEAFAGRRYIVSTPPMAPWVVHEQYMARLLVWTGMCRGNVSLSP